MAGVVGKIAFDKPCADDDHKAKNDTEFQKLEGPLTWQRSADATWQARRRLIAAPGVKRQPAPCRAVRPRCGKAAGCLCWPWTFDLSLNRLRSTSAANITIDGRPPSPS